MAAVTRAGRAVLIGTRSVDASEHVGELLLEAGFQPVILNARQDRQEAEIVACAGQPGRVTVATNLAGRGTDIQLHPAVREAGGLHVILTEYHESRRIDRQLFGRAGRQGDPGSYESIVALDDELFQRFAGAGCSAWWPKACGQTSQSPPPLGVYCAATANPWPSGCTAAPGDSPLPRISASTEFLGFAGTE